MAVAVQLFVCQRDVVRGDGRYVVERGQACPRDISVKPRRVLRVRCAELAEAVRAEEEFVLVERVKDPEVPFFCLWIDVCFPLHGQPG